MALCEYLCKRCGNIFELEQPEDADQQHTACPNCGEHFTKRLFSTATAESYVLFPEPEEDD